MQHHLCRAPVHDPECGIGNVDLIAAARLGRLRVLEGYAGDIFICDGAFQEDAVMEFQHMIAQLVGQHAQRRREAEDPQDGIHFDQRQGKAQPMPLFLITTIQPCPWGKVKAQRRLDSILCREGGRRGGTP
jgi:hypothetical protein